jgi:hypothetical protein
MQVITSVPTTSSPPVPTPSHVFKLVRLLIETDRGRRSWVAVTIAALVGEEGDALRQCACARYRQLTGRAGLANRVVAVDLYVTSR